MNYISFLKNLPKKLYFKLNTIRLYYVNKNYSDENLHFIDADATIDRLPQADCIIIK